MTAATDTLLDDLFAEFDDALGISVPEVIAVPEWTPQPKQQVAWDLAEQCDETLYGGAAGGGKSFFLAAYLVAFCLANPGAHVGLVRKTLPMLKQTHLVDTLPTFTAGLAVPNRADFTWTFANGSVLRFISLPVTGSEQNYKSTQFDVLGFEEVTELEEDAYTYMLSRLRSKKGYRAHSIATANPEGTGYAWVKRRFVKPKPTDLGKFQKQPKPLVPWRPLLSDGTAGPSRVFVPATIYDNKKLIEAQPEYILKLKAIADPRKRKALLEGDWDAMDQVPNALWSLSQIEADRVASHPDLYRILVAIDPAGTAGPYSDETGIIAAGLDFKGHGYVLADRSGKYGAAMWTRAAIQLYIDLNADGIVVETNAGAGKDSMLANLTNEAAAMVREGLLDVMPPFLEANASRGKQTRAEPIAGLYLRNVIHHVGTFDDLEEQMTTWVPSSGHSPDRVDALVWAFSKLAEQPTRQGARVRR